jgi:hypothetical protein
METIERKKRDSRSRISLWIFFVIGVVLIGSGLVAPQRTGLIDIGRIDLLTGILLATSAVVAVLLT